jgi:hypothetical protein
MRLLFSKSVQGKAIRLAGMTLLLGVSACASKPPVADKAVSATAGTQIYAPTGVSKFLAIFRHIVLPFSKVTSFLRK